MRKRKRNPRQPKPAPAKYRPAPATLDAPRFAGKYGSATAPAPAPPAAYSAPERKPAAFVPTARPTSRNRSQIERDEADALERREAAARAVTFTVMPGHKSGYQLVTDPELIKLMGKKP